MPQMPFSPCAPSEQACSDVSVGILQQIFGPIVDVLVRGGDPNSLAQGSNVLATMFGYFNSGILVVASIIISYVAAVGAINTANDGEAMGKAWSSVWTPLRIVAGGAVLLPSASGYSFIQIFVLSLALWSVGFANTIYAAGMSMGLFKPDGIVASSYQPGTYFGMRDLAKQYLAASYCARSANAVYGGIDGRPMILADFSAPDRTTTIGGRSDFTYYVKDRNGRTNLGAGAPICGTVSLSSYVAGHAYEDQSGTQAALDAMRADLTTKKVSAAVRMMGDIDAWVATMPGDITQTGWSAVQSSQLNAIVKKHEDQVAAQIAASVSGSDASASAVSRGLKAYAESLTKEGWAMSAGWYQRIGLLRSKLSTITSEAVGNVTHPSLSGLPSDARARLLINSVTTATETIVRKAELPANGYGGSNSSRLEDLLTALPKSSQSDINVGSVANDVGQKLSSVVNNMRSGAECLISGVNSTMQCATNAAIGGDSKVDAISRMKLTGDLLASYRLMFLGAKFSLNTAMTATRVVASGIGGVEVLGTKLDESGPLTDIWDWLQTEISPVLAEIAQYLGVLAFYFSVVLPSMPYAIFIITVVGWILGVIQTVIAAPLWAMMHMRPSQTFIGSDAQGYLLLLALFVRPALAVIGLFAAMLIADPIVDYISKAFFAFRGEIVASTGWIGAISQFFTFFWWEFAFGMLLLPVLYMIYGLPQVLPDHVLKWINAGVHDLGATGASAEMQRRYSPAAAAAGATIAQRLGNGGNDVGGRRGGPSLMPGGRGATDAYSSGGSQDTVMNAGLQGVMPASQDGGFDSTVAQAEHRSESELVRQRTPRRDQANDVSAETLSLGQDHPGGKPEGATVWTPNGSEGSAKTWDKRNAAMSASAEGPVVLAPQGKHVELDSGAHPVKQKVIEPPSSADRLPPANEQVSTRRDEMLATAETPGAAPSSKLVELEVLPKIWEERS
ncbi:MAG: DotA/TraY family protein [Telluria sp.]